LIESEDFYTDEEILPEVFDIAPVKEGISNSSGNIIIESKKEQNF